MQIMAEPWRTPHPYLQSQGDPLMFQYQQQGPFMPVQSYPPYPPPPYQTASFPAPICTTSEGAPMERCGSSYQAVLGPPPAEDLFRSMLQGPDIPSHTGTPQESANPVASTSTVGVHSASQYVEAQPTRPLASPSSSESNDPHPCSHCSYSPTTPEPVEPPPAKSGPVERGDYLPARPLPDDIRLCLEKTYGIYPEILEGYLGELPDGKLTRTMHREVASSLRTQLHHVPQGPYRSLMRSLPIVLRKRLRRIRRHSYVIRKGESKKLAREHEELSSHQYYDLRKKIRKLTQTNDSLQEEVVRLKDQVASYRRLRGGGGPPSLGSDGQQPCSSTG